MAQLPLIKIMSCMYGSEILIQLLKIEHTTRSNKALLTCTVLNLLHGNDDSKLSIKCRHIRDSQNSGHYLRDDYSEILMLWFMVILSLPF